MPLHKAINRPECCGHGTRQSVQLIRGPKGTEVRLTISPVEDRAVRRVVTLIRDESNSKTMKPKPNSSNCRTATAADAAGHHDLPSFYATVICPATPNIRRPKAPPPMSRA